MRKVTVGRSKREEEGVSSEKLLRQQQRRAIYKYSNHPKINSARK